MIKLKDILMESFFSKYYWMDSNGKFYEVESEGHAYWASEYLLKHNIPIDNNYKIYETMYKLGWVRVGLVGYQGKKVLGFNYSKSKPLSEKTLSYLKSFAIENDASEMRDDTSSNGGKIVDIDEMKLPPPIGDESSNPLNETMTYDDLLNASEKGRRQRAADVRVRSIPVTTENGRESWNFRYKSDPSVTGIPHQGYIQFLKESAGKKSAEDLECIVDCSCPDFRFRWAYANTQQDASIIGNKSLNKCINRAPTKMNPKQRPGLCKHLLALTNYLKTKIKRGSKQNIFESLNGLTKVPNFNVEMEND